MDDMEHEIHELIRSTEKSNREYHGQCIDADIEMLMDIEECLNQLDFDVQRWAIVYLAYRWYDARAKPHDDAPENSAEANHNAQFVEHVLRSARLPSRHDVLELIGENITIVQQVGALWEQLDAIGQPWAIQNLILEYVETWRELNEDYSEC